MFSEGEGNKNIPNKQMRISRQGGGLKLFLQTSKWEFLVRWVEINFSNKQMRFSRQGVVKKEYSKRENEMFSSGGWGEMI